jgi:CHAT domain-containing protein
LDLKRRFFAVILATVLSSSLYAQSPGTPTWKIYYDSAQSSWNKDWKKVISLLSRAEKSALSDLGIYDDNYLTIVNDLALAYARNNEYSTAEKLFAKIIGIKTESGNVSDGDYINTVINLGDVLSAQGKVQQAAKLYKKLISTTSEITSQNYWKVANNFLHLYEANNYLDSALLLSDKLKSETREDLTGNGLISDELSLTRGRLSRKLRKYEQSKVILETLAHSLQTNREPKGFLLYVRTLQEIGLLALETGSINNAEKNLLQCFRLLKSGNATDDPLLVEVLNNLASIYERLSITDKALAYYQDALNLCHQLNGTTDVTSLTIKSNIAGIHLKQGDLATAIASYEDILNTLKTSRSGVFYITVLNNLATAYRKSNQFPKATERLNEATKLINENKLDNEDLAAVVLNNRAVLHTALAEPEQAIVHFEKAYAIKRTLFGENSVSLKDLAGNMAVVYWALRKPDSAIPLFKKSIAMAIRQVRYIFPNLSEDEQIQFYQKTKEDFERFNAVAFQNAKEHPDLLKDVFNNQITLKSILFFTQQHRQVLINEKRDSLLTKQYETLRAKREQLGHFYQLPLKDLATAETSTSELEKEIDQLEKSISLKTSGTISEKMVERETTWEEIQKMIESDQGLIELIRFRKYDFKAVVENNTDRVHFGFTDSIFYAGLVTTTATINSPQLALLKDGNNMETRFLNYYRNALTYDVQDQNSYVSYWKPFEPFLADKSKIYVSGDGVYHRINLNTLRRDDTGEYLLQRYDIHYLLNPRQFIEKPTKYTSSKKAVLFGDPLFDVNNSGASLENTFDQLPGTNKEVAKINDILKRNGWTTSMYTQKMATEGSVKKIHSPDILHVATHGFFSTDNVKLNAEAKKDFLFYSGLAFAGANKNINEEKGLLADDGILTAFEVMNLDLSKTHLVVLSACETGLGKIENGEGVYGLQRSFLQAGARNIMISLWKVDDLMTQELMIQFYHYLFQGHSERAALKLAQLDHLKKHHNPFGWGGFIMVGID